MCISYLDCIIRMAIVVRMLSVSCREQRLLHHVTINCNNNKARGVNSETLAIAARLGWRQD